MRISESLRRNILEANVGGIVNKFKIKSRRTTFFFEELGSLYIKESENSGYSDKIERMGYLWMRMFFDTMMPSILKKIPATSLLNNIVKNVWVNVGTMDDFSVKIDNNTIHILSVNEGLTRYIGRNHLMCGFYRGVLESLLGKSVEFEHCSLKGNKSNYFYKVLDTNPEKVMSKDKKTYNNLNHLEKANDVDIRFLLKKNILKLNNNKIYFKNKMITNIENTLFHLIGNSGILIDKLPVIAKNFFLDIVDNRYNPSKNILLMKYLLQSMGWGKLTFIETGNSITLQVRNPPYGLQSDRDNWNFLAGTFLGFLLALDKNYSIENINYSYKQIRIKYST